LLLLFLIPINTFNLINLERIKNKCKHYNFEKVGKERAWLKDVLLSDTSSNDSSSEENQEEGIEELLYLHQLRKKYQTKFYDNPKVSIKYEFLSVNQNTYRHFVLESTIYVLLCWASI